MPANCDPAHQNEGILHRPVEIVCRGEGPGEDGRRKDLVALWNVAENFELKCEVVMGPLKFYPVEVHLRGGGRARPRAFSASRCSSARRLARRTGSTT